jgi:NADPH:quinone reductase-like Zn-dependent oxidoreductase
LCGKTLDAATGYDSAVLHRYGPPESLRYEEFTDPPRPGPDQVLIRIAAASVNPADGRLSRGEYPDIWKEFPRINGRDFAGTVVQAGPGVTSFSSGDRVYGFSELHWAGTWADMIVMPTVWIGLAPTTVTLTQAAALPVVALTAWVTLFVDFFLKAGQSLLINGAAGGVGSIAVQLAKSVGAKVIGSVSESKMEFARALGCDEVLDYNKTPIDSVLKNIDAVLDGVGGDSLRRSYRVLRPGGWLASMAEPVDQEEAQRAGIVAAQTRGRVTDGALARIAAEVDAGRLRIHVTSTYAMADAAKAHAPARARHGRD